MLCGFVCKREDVLSRLVVMVQSCIHEQHARCAGQCTRKLS